MLKCCGCQTNFILSLGGSFLFSKKFLSPPSLTGGLVMPIRRTKRLLVDHVKSTNSFFNLSAYLVIAPLSCSKDKKYQENIEIYILNLISAFKLEGED